MFLHVQVLPDGLHPKALKELASVLGVPLAILFNKSIQEGVLPEDWKCANFISIFKKGLKTEAGNYRPVSLTSVPCKVMESVLRDKMLKHLDTNDLLSHNQHGFTKNRSCLTNLLETLEEWTQALDEGHGVDAIFLDYQKAFDTVHHQRLISKLKGYGIGGILLKWIQDFLTNRKMRVVLNGHETDWAAVLSGVPQGSVLGPLLFLIYVNEIPEIIKSCVKMFADDTKLWRKIQSEEDEQILQQDLDRLEDWSKEWLLKFNASKCKVMQIGRKKTMNYHLRDGTDIVNLEETEMEKDLGVWINKDLKWSQQCRKSASKAMAVLGMIKRSFKQIDIDSFKILYNTYIRPHLEYCVQVWNPYYKKDIECLEKVQKRATKLARMPYEERLQNLGFFPWKEDE